VLPERLQAKALQQLGRLGVEVWFDAAVSGASPNQITLKDGRIEFDSSAAPGNAHD